MIAYFFHFCQSDFGDLWGHGEVGWLAAKKSAGRQRISATSPHLRCLLGFLPALKATDFAEFPFLRCLFALLLGEKATNFSVFPHLRCLLGFLPALKATDFAGVPFLRCLFALLLGGEAANFNHFPHLRCLLGFLPALKATDFAGFPFLPCSAVKRQRISALSPIYVALTPTPPKTNFFAKPIVTPPLVWYNTGYHRMFPGMLAWLGNIV